MHDKANTSGKRSDSSTQNGVSRRSVLKTGALTTGAAALAGCSGILGGSGGDTLLIGSTFPLSGPFSAVGENEKQAVQLAVDHANEEGDIDREVEVEFADTASDPATGRQNARELVQNGAELLVGNVSNSVALSIGEMALEEEVIYINQGGGLNTTGSECRPNVFVTANNAVGQSTAATGYALREGLGSSVYSISMDFSWGQSHKQYIEEVLVPRHDAEFLGNTFTPISTEDFSQAITTAENSGADIIAFNQAIGALIRSANQADEFGILDEKTCCWPAVGVSAAEAIGQEIVSHENFVGGEVWYWELESEGAQNFASAYRDAYDQIPWGFSATEYAGTRTALKAMQAAGTTEMDPVRQELEGRELFPQVWGVGEYIRGCDHATTVPTQTVRGTPPEDFNGNNYFQVLDIPDSAEQVVETQMRTCEETGCQLS